MKRIILFAAILLCASAASAQCTGSGLAFNCPSGATGAQVNTAISAASNNAVITFAAGTYTWNSGSNVQPSTTKGMTFICATAPLANSAATVNPCTVNSNGVAITTGGYPNNGFLYRISGFTFNQSGSNFLIYFCGGGSCSGVMSSFRIDHNTFNMAVGGAAVFFGDSLAHDLQAYGVIDHNTLLSSDHAKLLYMDSYLNNTPTTSELGTANNIFVENNILTNTTNTNSGDGCTDGWGSIFAVVVRYNAATNCRWLVHGTGDGGGPDNFEIYNNTTTWNAGGVSSGVADCYRSVHQQGAGTMVVFGNTCTPAPGQTDNSNWIAFQDFRECWNAAGRSCGEGVAPPICDGTSINVVYSAAKGPQTFSDGNRAGQTGYPCWHMPGRDEGGNIKPQYAFSNHFGDGTVANMQFNGSTGIPPPCTNGTNCSYDTLHQLQNRDWYDAASGSAQTSPTSPFDGQHGGVGFGTIANRPPTCLVSALQATENVLGAGTTGVGYFATNVGPQGTLYQCQGNSAGAGTWVSWYVPFTYPHPLVGGGSTFTPSPTSLTFSTAIVGQISGSQTVTMTPSGSVTISSIATTNAQFAVTGGTCPSSGTVSSPCTIFVAFTGLATGAQNANLVVTDSATGSPQTIPLTGTAANLPPGSAPQAFAGNLKASGNLKGN